MLAGAPAAAAGGDCVSSSRAMADIFISYKKEDAGRVIRLVEALRAEGLSVWWDHGIQAGSEWDRTIRRELDAARVVIAIWSESSVHAPWVREEANVGKGRGILLPIRIDEVDPPLGFTLIQAADLVGWRGDRNDRRWAFLLQSLRAIAGGEPVPALDAPLRARGGHSKRPLIGAIAGLAVALTILAAGSYLLLMPSPEPGPRASATPSARPADAPIPAGDPQAALAAAEPGRTAEPASDRPASDRPASDRPASEALPRVAIPVPLPPVVTAPPPARPQPSASEQALWDRAMKEKGRQGFQTYLISYPDGAYAQRARDILLTCRSETREEWKPGPAVANQMLRGVSDTGSGLTTTAACDRAKTDVRQMAQRLCETITHNGGFRNPRWSVSDRDCDCKQTSKVVTVCIADLPYSCMWDQKMQERIEICG